MFLNENSDILQAIYQEQWNDTVRQVKQSMDKGINEMLDHTIKMMSDTVDLDVLQTKHTALTNMIGKE